MSGAELPDGLISTGPDANCTLQLCPVDWSVLGYQPSLAANGIFIALFFIAMILHAVQGFRWRTWTFAICIILGCIDEIIGYVGRVMLYYDPFSFDGLLIQIVCVTTGPVFFCAAIYITLSETIEYLDCSMSRFPPRLLYWFFVPCDLTSLALQAAGGAMSTQSAGKQTGTDVSLVGLAFQVFTICLFIAAGLDYIVRFSRSHGRGGTDGRFKAFVMFLSVAMLLILVRCAYRLDELNDGYSGPLLRNEGLFIGLEGVMIVLAVFCLSLAQPGPALRHRRRTQPIADIELETTESVKPNGRAA